MDREPRDRGEPRPWKRRGFVVRRIEDFEGKQNVTANIIRSKIFDYFAFHIFLGTRTFFNFEVLAVP